MTPNIWNVNDRNCPADAVLIDRTTQWGNPYRIQKGIRNRQQAINDFEQMIERNPTAVAAIKRELKGKHLKCHCKPAACHGDVLLRIANS